MSQADYIQFNSMRTTIKMLVKAQIISQDKKQGDVWYQSHKHLVNQLVDEVAQKIVGENGKPTRKQSVMLDAAKSIIELLKQGYTYRFMC